jgi:hypothetical protein
MQPARAGAPRDAGTPWQNRREPRQPPTDFPNPALRNAGSERGGFSFRSPNNYMPKYIIERDIPDAGKLTADQLQGISQKSCGVLKQLGPQIQWVESYVTDNKVYCVYIAPNESMIREHAKQGGFPANRVSEVRNIIDPTTAEV